MKYDQENKSKKKKISVLEHGPLKIRKREVCLEVYSGVAALPKKCKSQRNQQPYREALAPSPAAPLRSGYPLGRSDKYPMYTCTSEAFKKSSEA